MQLGPENGKTLRVRKYSFIVILLQYIFIRLVVLTRRQQRTFRSSSQAATRPLFYIHRQTVEASHCSFFNAER